MFRLALALGKTVGEIEQGMSSAEFFEWAEFYRQEPFGDMRADFRNAMLCSVVANTYGKKKTKVSDFMVFLDKSVDSGASTVARTCHLRSQFQ